MAELYVEALKQMEGKNILLHSELNDPKKIVE